MNNTDDTGEKIIKFFIAVSKGTQLYTEMHPAVTTPLNNASKIINELLEKKDTVIFGVVNSLLFFEDCVFYEEISAVKQLLSQLEEKQLASIIISRGFENNDLLEVLKLIAMQDKELAETGAIRSRLSEKGITGITVKYTDEEDIEARAKKTYTDAVDIVASTFKEVRMGYIPKIDKTKKVVKDIVDIIFTDHNAMLCLTMIKDYDNYTFNHSVNVSILAVSIAKALNVSTDIVNEIGIAGLLHDIGKTHTAKEIITKPGKLTSEEFMVIKQHPEKGLEVLQEMPGISKNILDAVYQHHIHYDKKGYPEVGTDYQLNPYCTIITTADTYDAITTHRTYQEPVTPKAAIDIMLRFEDKRYEKRILRKFIEILGVYPTGSFVRLDTNEIALVTKQNPDNFAAPVVKIVIDREGSKLIDIVETDLSEKDTDNDKYIRGIVSAVDPTFIGLNISDYI